MSDLKTKVNDASVEDFLNKVNNETKRKDSFTLLEMFTRLTGEKAKMWGASIVGFGKYHYKSERSSQEGDWPMTGFSPRKAALTLYIHPGMENNKDLLSTLGKHKTSIGCLYINKLSDVNLAILEKLIKNYFDQMKKKHGLSTT